MAATPLAHDEELFVRCKTCGFPVATGLRLPPGALETADLPPDAHRCPRCGHAHEYTRGDHVHRV
jgi:hypothetical protein